MAACTACSRPTDVTICAGCVGELTTALHQVPWLVEELTTLLAKQNRMGDRNGPRSTERPLVLNMTASVELGSLRDVLEHAARAVAEPRHLRLDTAPTADGYARWLLRWTGELATHPDAADLCDGIVRIVASCRNTIDRPADRRYLGPCDDCGADLYAHDRGGRLPDTITCRNMVDREDGTHGPCATQYPMVERRAWLLEAAMNMILTPVDISRAISGLLSDRPLSPNTISQWAARGLRIDGDRRQLTPQAHHPEDPHKRARYRVEEVVEFYWAANKISEKAAAA